MREFKKYPNRRLYDIQESRYVTVEDLRKIILQGESIVVADSKTAKDLTRTVLLQIISEQVFLISARASTTKVLSPPTDSALGLTRAIVKSWDLPL